MAFASFGRNTPLLNTTIAGELRRGCVFGGAFGIQPIWSMLDLASSEFWINSLIME